MKEFKKELIENYKELASVFKMKYIVKVFRIVLYIAVIILLGMSVVYTADCIENTVMKNLFYFVLIIVTTPLYITIENRLLK